MINTTALKEARRARGLSQAALAEQAGVAQQLIGQLERGEVRSTKAIYRIAKTLGVPAQQLDDDIPDAEESERRTIPLVGYVGAGAEIFAIDDHAKGGGLEEVVRYKMRDPASTQFRNIKAVRKATGEIAVCGEANAKNGFGGYGGFSPFYGTLNGETFSGVTVGYDAGSSATIAQSCAMIGAAPK